MEYNGIYKIKITNDCKSDLKDIFRYICINLKAKEAAKRLMKKIKERIMELSTYPKIHMEIEKFDRNKRKYRRIIVDNYIILYIIDDNKKIVYVTSIFYSRKNYLYL